jgi:DNA ligase 1
VKSFARLFEALDASTSTSAKVAALKDYFVQAPAQDAAWATYFLAGGKPKQAVSSKVLRQAALEASGLAEWLFEESYQAVGDIAETIAVILPPPENTIERGLAKWMIECLLVLRGQPPEMVVSKLCEYWSGLDVAQRFLMNKLITGGFRVGVSKLLVIRGLSEATGIDRKVLAQRLIGYTDSSGLPTREQFEFLIDTSETASNAQQAGQPYPFFLAHQWALDIADQTGYKTQLASPENWQIEWKWDGIRAQLVKRQGQWWLWSRGEEIITDRFPELAPMAMQLPDGTVLDGEILAWDMANGIPQPFAKLQQRITRKSISKKLLADIPVVMVCYDLLELNGQDIRATIMRERRAKLQTLAAEQPLLCLSEIVTREDWISLHQLREQARTRGVEGFMLKAVDSRYGVGRTKADGLWWKWKVDPLTIDCVLIYAQRGHGRRASLYTDFTFAVWDGEALVPFAKAYSGLTDAEFKRVDDVIRKTTLEKFGPVRSVTPTLVFELGFEGIQASPRHKSGVAVRFPRILRWREDKAIGEADTLANLKALI